MAFYVIYCSMTTRGHDVRIIIVGAGIAGLSAAHHLMKNGFANVLVLEASDR